VISVEIPTTAALPSRVLILSVADSYVHQIIDSGKKSPSAKDVMSALKPLLVAPLFDPECALIVADDRGTELSDALADFEQKSVSCRFKFGLLFAGAGQSTEEQFYNNREGSPAYNAFLELIGQRIVLAGECVFLFDESKFLTTKQITRDFEVWIIIVHTTSIYHTNI
jgi:hypothetical protein